LNTFLFIELYPDIFKFSIVFILLICSALISGFEVAFFSLSEKDIKKISLSKNKKDLLVLKLRNKPRRLLSTLLISNNFINISIVLILASFGKLIYFNSAPDFLNFIIMIGLIAFLILLFGEILPKVYANKYPISFAKKMAIPINFLDKYIFFFMTIPMSKITQILQNRLVVKNTNLSVEKLSDALDLTDKNETSIEEKMILKGIISLGHTKVKQIMRPRIDVFSVNIKTNFKELIDLVRKNKYSRIPVFDKKIDNVIGVIYLKDLFPHMEKNKFNWYKLIKEPYLVPEDKRLDDLLKEFQQSKNHIAVVVDEYGGKSGIITLNDIVEEIVGEINDDLNQDDVQYSRINKNTYIFEGKVVLKDLYRILSITDYDVFESIKGDSETLGGFLLEQTGFFPKKNYKINIKEFEFKIVDLDRKRIKKVMVTVKK